jgi:hypothetical protein
MKSSDWALSHKLILRRVLAKNHEENSGKILFQEPDYSPVTNLKYFSLSNRILL